MLSTLCGGRGEKAGGQGSGRWEGASPHPRPPPLLGVGSILAPRPSVRPVRAARRPSADRHSGHTGKWDAGIPGPDSFGRGGPRGPFLGSCLVGGAKPRTRFPSVECRAEREAGPFPDVGGGEWRPGAPPTAAVLT